LEAFDQERLKMGRPNDLLQDAQERANHLLAKARLQLDEQEDEIKNMNSLILNAKCVVIRNLQLNEKVSCSQFTL
jgi:hypothetical protein